MTRKAMLITGIGTLVLVAMTAGATAWLSGDAFEGDDKASSQRVEVSSQTQQTTTQAPPACDDDNIVGKVVGGAAGGLAGSQIGSGSGKTAATIGGAVGGTLLGEEYIPTKNVTCR